MIQKFSVSLPDDVYELVQNMAAREGTTVSGFLARLAKQRADADRASREWLARRIEQDRAADPEGYDRRRAEIRERMHAAKQAAAAKKAGAA
ncbi:putative CopG family antitoxin [Thermocatellispora tengchongensis]|uniref:Putative CopG family antitoxin n=1 Tax=Thermocatellispora tengchongensis TaxID=1073253 RepID=A0A840P5H7_9ACTN|nr:ribbon-helix-helix protein, CopG family [Thermocatellispora tengchongensis]MBB5133163.1 putative CopG family antitoxin [Thermocatellispora tengchongensis]